MTEEMKREWHLDRRVTLGLIVALLVHAGTSIWWASDLTTRVKQIEQDQRGASQVPQRMTRVETQVDGVREDLQRIERKLDRIIEAK